MDWGEDLTQHSTHRVMPDVHVCVIPRVRVRAGVRVRTSDRVRVSVRVRTIFDVRVRVRVRATADVHECVICTD